MLSWPDETLQTAECVTTRINACRNLISADNSPLKLTSRDLYVKNTSQVLLNKIDQNQ